jgi:hypothetical protein
MDPATLVKRQTFYNLRVKDVKILLEQELRTWLQDVQVAVEHFYPTLAFHLATLTNTRPGAALQV